MKTVFANSMDSIWISLDYNNTFDQIIEDIENINLQGISMSGLNSMETWKPLNSYEYVYLMQSPFAYIFGFLILVLELILVPYSVNWIKFLYLIV